MSETILFTTEKPSFYLLSEIYDSVTNPTGTVIPRPNSLVIDPINNGLLQRVLSVSPVTFNSILGPVVTSLLAPSTPDIDPADTSIVSIIDYGNSRFYLFYDKAEHPTKLNLDKKIIILGDDAVSFEVSRWDASLQRYIPISLYYDTDGIYKGTKIPLNVISTASNAKIPSNCHTSYEMNDDEVYHMFIYDYAGTQCGAMKLFAKKAIVNNSLGDDLLITDFVIESTQMDNDGLYLFPDQDPGSLVITPRVIYNDGTSAVIPIDNAVCHLYGLEGFTASYPGQTVEVLAKYFLVPTQQAVTDCLTVSGSQRYLVKTALLTVKDPGTNEYSIKILTVPSYISSVSRWVLLFYLYSLNDNTVRNITSFVTIPANFDGRLYGIEQHLLLNLRIRDIFPDAATDFIYQQTVLVKLAPYDYYERYTLRDSVGDTYGIFGVDSPILARPVLYYDSSIDKYFIPTTKFNTKDVMLEAFYYKARPLYDSSWLSAPPNPSHFTIRHAVTGALLLSTPVAITGYEQGFSLVGIENPNQLVGSSCIVEFLQYEQNQYKVLYGVPVDCYAGTFV